MSILSFGDLASDSYHDFSWKDIFCSAGASISTNAEPMGLVNKKNLIMVPDNFCEYKDIKICFPTHSAQCIGEDILFCSWSDSLVSGITFLKINAIDSTKKTDNQNKIYVDFLYEIVSRVSAACHSIFKYTYEHLSHRYVGDDLISNIPIVRSDFSVIYSLLEKLAIAIKNIFCIYDAIYCSSLAIEALSILSTLSGARSVLRNRSLELLYHLKIFERFIHDGLVE